MQQYKYPKLIWMKQNIIFACSYYQSIWQLTDNFCLHSSEPNRIETQRKCIMNRIVTTELRYTVNLVNPFTFTYKSRSCMQRQLRVSKHALLQCDSLSLSVRQRWESLHSIQSSNCLNILQETSVYHCQLWIVSWKRIIYPAFKCRIPNALSLT